MTGLASHAGAPETQAFFGTDWRILVGGRRLAGLFVATLSVHRWHVSRYADRVHIEQGRLAAFVCTLFPRFRELGAPA